MLRIDWRLSGGEIWRDRLHRSPQCPRKRLAHPDIHREILPASSKDGKCPPHGPARELAHRADGLPSRQPSWLGALSKPISDEEPTVYRWWRPRSRWILVELRPPCRENDTRRTNVARSEEHTSELQSHSDLVCRLLLEKKKKNNKI